jgi:hypothetical protein
MSCVFIWIAVFISLCIQTINSLSNPANGSINLSTLAFDKILKRFKYLLVKFDVELPHNMRHKVFVSLAGDVFYHKGFLISEVRINRHGTSNNGIAERFGVVFSRLPYYFLFRFGNTATPEIYYDDTLMKDQLKHFLIESTDLYIPMDGCLEDMDPLAHRFIEEESNRRELLKQMEAYLPGENETSKYVVNSYQVYVKIAQRLVRMGAGARGFLEDEKYRLRKVLEGNLSPQKRESVGRHINILMQFRRNWALVRKIREL